MREKTRISILVVYDKDGKVDDYLLHLIKELVENTTRLIVVVNGELTEKSFERIGEYTQEIFIRKNEGYDVTAWKEALEKYIGWEQVKRYEELLLVNDSFYGPFCSLKHIFEQMEERKADFWGLTEQYPMPNTFGAAYEGKMLPYHIQSFFIVVRKNMLRSEEFQKFWHDLPQIVNFSDAVTKYELCFTEYFKSKGYLCDTYVKSKIIDSRKEENGYSYLMYNPCEMITRCQCPIIKKKCFSMPYYDILEYSMGEDAVKCLQYIESHTSYDVSMIWKNLIRTMDPGKLNNSLHMRYVLPHTFSVDKSIDCKVEQVAVIAHMYYPELIEIGCAYLCRLPKGVDIFITTTSEENKCIIQEKMQEERDVKEIIVIGNRGREIRGLLVECAEIFKMYKYVCFVHDKRTTGNLADKKIGQSYMYTLWQSMLKSSEYVQNIISLLQQKEYLGILAPVPVYHWNYFGYLGNEWTNCFENTKKLAERIGIQCVISEEYSPIALGTAFWCKTDALLPLFTHAFVEEDFQEEPLSVDGTLNHSIERILPYVAQSQGYATGIVMSDEYARLHLSNYHRMINGVMNQERKMNTSVTYRDYVMMNMDEHITDFFMQNKKIFVYGTGDFASRVTRFINANKLKIEGYIVSEGHKNTDIFEGKKVYCISEIEYSPKEVGIIVALNKNYQKEVIPILEDLGYDDLCIM